MKILTLSTLKTAFSAGIVVALLGTAVGCTTVTPGYDGQKVYYPQDKHHNNGNYSNGRYKQGNYDNNGHHKNHEGKKKNNHYNKNKNRYNNNGRYNNNHYRYKQNDMLEEVF